MCPDHEGNRKGDISPSWGQPNMRVYIRTIETLRTPRSRGGGRYDCVNILVFLSFLLSKIVVLPIVCFVSPLSFFFSTFFSTDHEEYKKTYSWFYMYTICLQNVFETNIQYSSLIPQILCITIYFQETISNIKMLEWARGLYTTV